MATARDDPASVEARIATVPHWHHRIPIAPGITTPGVQDSDTLLARVQLPEDCTGMRVLDVGARDGFFSFEVERRGAVEVVALDNVPPDLTGFTVAKELLGSKASYVVDNVYNLSADELGTFDLVLCLGVIYHLRHPLLALDRIRDVSHRDTLLYVESHIIDDGLVDADGNFHRLRHFHPDLEQFGLMQLLTGIELGGDPTLGWAPNQRGLSGMLVAAGFDVVREWRHAYRGGATAVAREIHRARSMDAAAEWDLSNFHVIRGTRYSPAPGDDGAAS